MRPLLTPPLGTKVTETLTSTFWFDNDGIMYTVNKKVDNLSMQQTLVLLDEFKQMAQGRKFCMLIDGTNSNPGDKATREFAAKELPDMVYAIATVSRSAMGRMLANLFFALIPPSYPAKAFNNEAEAREWLKQYLPKNLAA